MPGSIEALWPHAMDAFQDVDYIMHAGDLHTLEIVDRLSELAPTYVARGNGDADIIDERLADTWLLELKGIQIGMIHHFPSPARKSADHLDKHITKNFSDKRPDILIYGHTHMEDVRAVNGCLFINPGSPTLPQNQSLRPGTIGYLEILEDHIVATILQLTATGIVAHESIQPVRHGHVRGR